MYYYTCICNAPEGLHALTLAQVGGGVVDPHSRADSGPFNGVLRDLSGRLSLSRNVSHISPYNLKV